MTQYLGIEIDLTLDDKYGEFSLSLLKKHYLKDDETSPQHAFARAATNYCYGDYEFAQRMYNYVSKQHACFASPVISNAVAGKWDEACSTWGYSTEEVQRRKNLFSTDSVIRAMPVSCFLTYIDDTLPGQKKAATELATLSTLGGGVGSYMGMRGITDKSPGAIPYLKTMDSNILYYHQAGTRRGSVAAYLDIRHPDLMEFLGVRTPTGGDINRKSFNAHIAVNITDDFLDAIDNDADWDFIDPASHTITKTIGARDIWQQILETRFRTGEPYLHYVDESNRRLHPALKEKGLSIKSSNLCVSGDTIVTIMHKHKTKTITISDLVELHVTDDIKVLSKNLETGDVGFFDVVAAKLTTDSSHVVELEVDGKKLVCTPDHKVYTADGYKEAKDLLATDVLDIQNGSDEFTSLVITDNHESIPVYDITVDIAHNFYANDILIHNCSEIILPIEPETATSVGRSAICVLSSLNVEMYDDWKDTTIVQDFTRFLDNVVQWFIDYAPLDVPKTINSARSSRDIGIGQMGWHYFLMSKNIAYESGGVGSAAQYASIIAKLIHDRSLAETQKLAIERGEPDDLIGTGLRNAHRIAIAPNANSSIIAQTSPSTELTKANIYTHRTRVGSYTIKNKYLDKLIESLDCDYDAVWQAILADEGSIQNIDVFSDHDKNVYKTANEVDQLYVIDQARIRQQYIDQSASVNLYHREGTTKKHLNKVHRRAFSRDPALPGVPLKTLYYLRSSKASNIENISGKLKRDALRDYETEARGDDECLACHS